MPRPVHQPPHWVSSQILSENFVFQFGALMAMAMDNESRFCRAFLRLLGEQAWGARFSVPLPLSVAGANGTVQRDDHQSAEEVDDAPPTIAEDIPTCSHPCPQYASERSIKHFTLHALGNSPKTSSKLWEPKWAMRRIIRSTIS